MSDAQVVSFEQAVRTFLLINGSPREIMVKFTGFQWIVPPRDVVTYPHPKFDDVPVSGKDADGDWIAGTIEIKDQTIAGNGAEEPGRFFNAQDAVVGILGIKNGVAQGSYARAGLSLLKDHPTKAEVESVREAAKNRYEVFALANAQAIVDDHETRNERRRRTNQIEMPATPAVRKAQEVIARQIRAEHEQVERVFGSVPTTEPQIDEGALELAMAIKAKALARQHAPAGSTEAEIQSLAEETLKDKAIEPMIRASVVRSQQKPGRPPLKAKIPTVTDQEIGDQSFAGAGSGGS